MDFIPNTDEERELMLRDIGISIVSELFKDIPDSLLLKDSLKIPSGLSEIEVKDLLKGISYRNKVEFSYFLGAQIPHPYFLLFIF